MVASHIRHAPCSLQSISFILSLLSHFASSHSLHRLRSCNREIKSNYTPQNIHFSRVNLCQRKRMRDKVHEPGYTKRSNVIDWSFYAKLRFHIVWDYTTLQQSYTIGHNSMKLIEAPTWQLKTYRRNPLYNYGLVRFLFQLNHVQFAAWSANTKWCTPGRNFPALSEGPSVER